MTHADHGSKTTQRSRQLPSPLTKWKPLRSLAVGLSLEAVGDWKEWFGSPQVRRCEGCGAQRADLAEAERKDADRCAQDGQRARAADRVDQDPADEAADRQEAERHDPRGTCDPSDELVRGVRGPNAHVEHDPRRL